MAFCNRIMFPIRNIRGQVIGFGGRVLDDSKPKYINSPDTETFQKGKNLYGLYEMLQHENKPARAIVVEGYTDVIALAQHGIHYGAATLGTAVTPDHLKLLFRYTNEIIFCFDGDRAGRKAARKALEITLPVIRDGRHVRFMFLAADEDPESMIRKEGVSDF
nr:toprim domain-containing protein [Methylomarinum sp. Ch1-1]MDP4518971.1 toprim domain-containing protein [Methylomarinum sp. Ch1-1]